MLDRTKREAGDAGQSHSRPGAHIGKADSGRVGVAPWAQPRFP